MAGAVKKAVAKVTKKKEVPVADKAFQQKGFNKPEGFKGGSK